MKCFEWESSGTPGTGNPESEPKANFHDMKQMELFPPVDQPLTVTDVHRRDWLHLGSTVSMADGSERAIHEIQANDLVLTVNEETYVLEPRRVKRVLARGIRQTLVLKTAARALRCSPDQQLLANNAWVDAGNVKVGDLVAVPKRLTFGGNRIPDYEVDLLALWLAEGAGYRITNQTPEIIQVMADAAAHYGLIPMAKDGLNWGLFNGDRTGGPRAGSKNPFRKMLESYGEWGLTSKTKFIPPILFQLPEDQLSRFLNLFIACDGCINRRSKNTWALEIGLANELMVRQLAKLLHKFGIRGQVSHKVHKAVSRRHGQHFESWRFITSDPASIEAFASRIGALSKETQTEKARDAAACSRGNCNAYLPIAHDDFVEHLRYTAVPKGKFGGYNYTVSRDLPDALRAGLTSWRKQTPSRISISRYENLRRFSDDFFRPVAESDVAWEAITAVQHADSARTWALVVQGNHNFVAEGLVNR